MSLFHYKTIDKKGQKNEGTIEAKDKFALYHSIKTEDNTVIFAEELKSRKALSFMSDLPFLNGVKTHAKIAFAQNLAKMLDARFSMTRDLSII